MSACPSREGGRQESLRPCLPQLLDFTLGLPAPPRPPLLRLRPRRSRRPRTHASTCRATNNVGEVRKGAISRAVARGPHTSLQRATGKPMSASSLTPPPPRLARPCDRFAPRPTGALAPKDMGQCWRRRRMCALRWRVPGGARGGLIGCC
jgi:hypothetical protein